MVTEKTLQALLLSEMSCRPWMELIDAVIVNDSYLGYEEKLLGLKNQFLDGTLNRDRYQEDRATLESLTSDTSFLIHVFNLPTFFNWLRTTRAFLAQIFHSDLDSVAQHLHSEFDSSTTQTCFHVTLCYRSLRERQKVYSATLAALKDIPV